MKRRVLSLAITLALCLNLCPVWVLAAEESGDSFPTSSKFTLESNKTYTSPCEVKGTMEVDTNGYTLTGSKSDALHVTPTGKLSLTGKVTSEMGVGIVVQSGGVLNVSGSDTCVMGSTHALKIASGAAAQLSAGEYFAGNTVIVAENGDYAALLAPGCAYFSADGNPILPADMAQVKRVTISVGPCAGHSEKTYAHDPGAPTHTWTCPYCGTKESEKCTFAFDGNGHADCCEQCGNSITIAVDESALGDLIYNGADQSANVTLTVSLGDGTTLVKDKDYGVDYSTRADVGEITVTVTGITFNGNFTKTYQVNPDQPILQWATNTAVMDYDGSPVEKSDLPAVSIQLQSAEDLHGYLQYFHKVPGDSDYISGLPTNAGTYDVIVRLPKMQNFEAAESDSLTLTINQIKPIIEAPKARTLTFNYTAQELVTSGTLNPIGERDGLEIQFATNEAGPYSSAIPTGTDAGNSYRVWYKVVGLTGNYIEPNSNPAEVASVEIQRKEITPNITLSQLSFVYTGGKQEPIITVRDGTIEVGKEQYTVTWEDENRNAVTELKDVGTYTATIEGKTDGNYKFSTTAQVEIVEAAQGGLSITGFPTHVYYGDTITTLGTSGGTGAGTVKWSVDGTGCTIDPTTGRLTVKGTGTFTVKAERTVPNYGTVSDSRSFTVEPKPVMAEVTVTAKSYNGDTTANVTATVKASDLVNAGDTVNITGLAGTYDNANAGKNKTVTLDDSNATKADGSGKYNISYPAAVKGDINPRSVNVSVTLSGNDLQQDANGYFYTFDGTDKTPTVTVTGTDGSYNATLAASDYSVSYANNKNVGKASVTVTAEPGGNYTFNAETVNFTIRNTSAVLISTPQAKDLTYDKTAQDLVTVGVATGGTVMYSKTQSGTYSETIPQETAAGTYIVYYMVKGDANHTDTAPGYVSVTIKPKEITPTITLSPTSYVYDGSAKNPSVTVMDGNDTIDAAEYSVTYQNNVNAGTATAVVSDANGGNYLVREGRADFTIGKADSTFTTTPQAKTGLQYTGQDQELVLAGGSAHGTVVYSVNGGNYSAEIPTASAVDTYKIDCKILGDANHSDTAPVRLEVKIAKNTVSNPKIWLSSDTFRYTGSQQQPEITVCDDSGRLIPRNEYEVEITGTNGNVGMVDVDTYTVTITTPPASNYVINTNNTKTYKIVAADQETISITGTKGQVFYGEVIQLGTTGGTGSGTVTWTIAGNTNTTLQNGLLTVKDSSGSITVTATRSRDNYDDISATWEFTPAKKPVTAVLTGVDKVYDGDNIAVIRAEVNAGDFAFDDSFTIPDLTGTFEDEKAGNNKKVTRTDSPQPVSEAANYDIAYPLTTTASILKADAAAPALTGNNREYDGTTRDLVSGGNTNTTLYSDARDGAYSTTVPTGTNAGTYTVWYIELGDDNHNDSAPQGLQVTISRKPLTANATNITLTDHDLQTDNSVTPPAYSYVYDGTEKKPTVTIKDGTAEVPDSEYTVKYSGNRNVGTATVTITSNAGGNYDVSGSITFQIKAATASVIDAPQPKNLTYNGSAQELVTPGAAANGRVVYSKTQTGPYTTSIPSEENAGTYTVWYKVQGDNGASDTSPVSVSVTIKPQTVNNPTILLDNQLTYSAPYTGKAVEPAVTLIVNGQLLNDTSKYTVTYSNNTNIGTATVIVQSTTGGNYQFYAVTTFQIVKAKGEFTAPPQANQLVYTGQAQELVTAGTANGIVLYSLDAASYTARIPTGINAGSYTVYAKVQGSSQYEESDVVVIPVEIGKNEVSNPKVTLSSDSFSYNGSAQKPAVTVSDGSGNVIPAGEYEVTCSGDATNPGTYTLTVASRGINYSFAPVQCEFTILAPGVTQAPEKVDGLVYNGSAQALVSGGTAESGALVYSLDNSSYSADIPTGTNAGPYRVWYKADSASDTDVAPPPIEVEIAKATPSITKPTATGTEGQKLSEITLTGGKATLGGTEVPGTFAWTDGTLVPGVGTSQQNVTFTQNDTDNFNSPVTFPVTVTVNPASGTGGGGTSGTGSTPPADTDSSPSADTDSTPSADTGSTPQTTVQNGTASTFVSAAAGSRLVRQAAANQSQNIVIQPEITSDVTRSEVSIPASTVSEIQSKTNAALTVSAPMADVTIPNEALGALGSAGGTVNVVTEQVGQSVALTLTAGGQKVDSVPGGLTLSVPAEDAGPGTVAVLVHDDGTRETIRKSVVDDGKVNIPLDGSATVEIVDNSKEFTDVPPESWASDAVAFASAHELFSGTSETTFSPDEPISRGMLATVLYSLEGSPAQDTADEFSDVSGDAWYADGVAWATENGIADGYGNGQFGPDDSITREQFVVMLWKYAGSPEASDQTLAFTDADQVSGYARQALCWAVEKGVLSGGSDGQLAPGKTATRAQAAQMLKSFMENA